MQNPFGNNNNNDQNPFDLNNLPLPPNYAKIVNDQGQIRIAKVGISWTTLWFGPLPALFRGDYYNFILMIVLDLDYALVVLFFGLNWLTQFPWPSLVFASRGRENEVINDFCHAPSLIYLIYFASFNVAVWD